MDRTLGRDNVPGPISTLVRLQNRAETLNFRAAHGRTLGVGMGDAAGIHLARVSLIHRTMDAIQIQQRMQALGFIQADLIKLDAIHFCLGSLNFQLVRPLSAGGKVEVSMLVNAARLLGFPLKLFIQLHGVVLQLADVVGVVKAMNVGSRVPG